jgi:tetratricopeptide (TPR) repeat protein
VKKPQWIIVIVAIVSTTLIFLFARTVPPKVTRSETPVKNEESRDLTTDSILIFAKRQLTPEQVVRINTLENSISRGDVKDQKLKVYHQLAHFWNDSARIFEPYAWYEAEAARLENSEKSLTFAAHLFLENLQVDNDPLRKKWKALQARDLFERSLILNPVNDSAKIGLGACYLFGGISPNPMEGILKIREVVEKDSTNVYAQLMLAKGSMISGQYDKAITRMETVNRLQPGNIEAILMLADVNERMNKKEAAIQWYQKSLQLIERQDVRREIELRITELSGKTSSEKK